MAHPFAPSQTHNKLDLASFNHPTAQSNAFQNFSGELFNSINDRTNRSCGVSVWFSSKLNYNIINTKTDKGGRIISLLLNIDDVKCNIINVYCPNIPAERRIFMSNISSYILCDDAPHHHVLSQYGSTSGWALSP